MSDSQATSADAAACEAAFKALTGGDGAEPIRGDVAVSRAGALLTLICRMTADPERALQFAIVVLKERLAQIRGKS